MRLSSLAFLSIATGLLALGACSDWSSLYGQDCGGGVFVATDAVCQSGSVCGDDRLEASEECDDGNTQSGDGCSASCKVESADAPTCGDDRLEAGEECDDGNTESGDGCSSACERELDAGLQTDTAPSCGNGTIDPG